MGRPKINRMVTNIPEIKYFKPQGIPVKNLLTEKLAIEELEALPEMQVVQALGAGRWAVHSNSKL